MKRVAVIMAGGKGERFWPASRVKKPKQLLAIVSEHTMIRETVNRIAGIIDKEGIFVVTSALYKEAMIQELNDIPSDNIICEPEGRDTANAIALAGVYIAKKFPESVICVLSADHSIQPVDDFARTITTGFDIAEKQDVLITIGIIPKRAETGYGYIQKGEKVNGYTRPAVYQTASFKEKPTIEVADEYYKSGKFLWNSGMFIWKNSYFLEQYAQFLPDNWILLKNIQNTIGTPDEQDTLYSQFTQLQKISVDYGILEKSKNILCIAGEFEWDDVGSWSSMYRHVTPDFNGNVIKGKGALLESSNCLIYSDDDTLVSVIDMDDLMIIKSGNAVLVCRKKDDQKVKQLIEQMKADPNKKNYL